MLMYAYLGWTLLAAFLLSLILWIGRAASHRQIKSSWVYCALGAALWLIYRSETGAGASLALAFAELALLQSVVSALDVALFRRFHAPKFVTEILLAGGYVVVLISVLAHLGLNITGLITTSAVVTAIIGLSLQDMLINFVGGVVLELEQTVKVGDWIRTEHASGAVTAVSLRHTVILTEENDTVLVPNSSLIRLPVTIVSRKHRILVPFHMPYGGNPARIVDAVGQALATSPINSICADPRPRCVITEFHPSHISFGVFAWLNQPANERTAVSAILTRVHFALDRLGQPLASISQAVELSRAPIAHPDPEARIARDVEILRSLSIFASLSLAVARELALSLKHAAFAPGELIIRQGDEGDSMYVVIAGSVDVHVVGESGMSEYLATLEVGQFFGEMSLLTGEQRAANVMSMATVECLVIGKSSLVTLFERHPELAENISEVIAARQVELRATRDRLDGEQKRVLAARSRVDMLHRIQRYFGISDSGAAAGR